MLKIITDSAADVPKNEAEQYDIRVMGIPITVDGVSYRESVDFTSEEYYGMLTAAKAIPTTAQITLMEFAEVFREEIASAGLQYSIDGFWIMWREQGSGRRRENFCLARLRHG